MRSAVVVGVLAGMLVAAPVFGQSLAAGRVKIVSGSAFVVRDGKPTPVKSGDLLFEGDTLRTGGDSHLGIALKDETRISLGPSSEVRLDQFLYVPAESRFGVALRLVRGVAAYVSGRIARLAPDSIRLETPAAIVGIRGTTLVLQSE